MFIDYSFTKQTIEGAIKMYKKCKRISNIYTCEFDRYSMDVNIVDENLLLLALNILQLFNKIKL